MMTVDWDNTPDPLQVLDDHQWDLKRRRILPKQCKCGYPADDMPAHQVNMLMAAGYRLVRKEDIVVD